MRAQIRFFAGAVLLAALAVGCTGQSPIQPDGPSFDKAGTGSGTGTGDASSVDSTGMHTGYFGSGHNQQDTMPASTPG